MTNFTPFTVSPALAPFAEIASAAERILHFDPAASVLNCRRAMEAGIKWMYSVDDGLTLPWDDRLASLLDNEDFRGIVDRDLLRRMDLIRRLGNQAAHAGAKITEKHACCAWKICFTSLTSSPTATERSTQSENLTVHCSQLQTPSVRLRLTAPSKREP